MILKNSEKIPLKSLIVTVEDEEILDKWIINGNKNIKRISYELLYRGSKDGFQHEDFISRCGGKGPTITLIESVEN